MNAEKENTGKTVLFPTAKSSYNAKAERQRNVIGRRIQTARHDQKISLGKFSAILKDHGVEVSVPAISKWERGESSPNAYQIIAIAQALMLEDCFSYFMESCTENTLNAEGRRKLHEYRELLLLSDQYKTVPSLAELEDDELELPKLLLRPSAGAGGFMDADSYSETVRFPRRTVPDGTDFVMNISGDSMEPVYQSGQLIFVHRCETLQPGDVGIFLYDGEGYIKEYREIEPESPEDFTDSTGVRHKQPVLVSFNKAYPPRLISVSARFQIFGKVLN